MLPIYVETDRPSLAALPKFSEYMRRMLQRSQMDIEYTFVQMSYLCFAPRKVYQLTSYRKQTKNQWARDDPAFVVVLVFFLFVASVAYGVAFQVTAATYAWILTLFIAVHFLAGGAVVATFTWFVSNKYLRLQTYQNSDQNIQWMYAFDIHCNSFCPVFFVLYVVHYLLLPFLIQPMLSATICSNSLYFIAWCYYSYITSLGYSTLPFLERTEVFLYPTALVLIGVVALCHWGINLTHLSLLALGV